MSIFGVPAADIGRSARVPPLPRMMTDYEAEDYLA